MEKYDFTKEKRELLESLPQALAVYQFLDNRVVTILLTDGFCSLFGFADRKEAFQAMDQDMYRMNHPEDAARIAEAALKFAREEESYDVFYRTRFHHSAEYRIVHAKGEHVKAEDGTQLAYVWYMDEGAWEEKADGKAPVFNPSGRITKPEGGPRPDPQYDDLTGLPDKSYFFPLAAAGTRAIHAAGDHAAFLFLDLNGMKYYNTKFSFAEGDRLLHSFGRLLGKTFANENCCHLGGDHFTAYTKAEGLEEVLAKMFEECKELNEGNSLPVHVGICVIHTPETPLTVAIDRAKYACDSLRSTYESSFGYFNETLNDNLEHRRYILSNFDQALEKEWIQVYYQPIVRAVSSDVCDEEALARWIDPEKGKLSPSMFIPILEEARVIYKLDLYMLDQILKKIKAQEEAGLFLVPQSLNLSRSDFDSCDMVEEVCRRVDEAGVRHDLITIEITESTVGNNHDFMKKQIERFQSYGFPVWMDDFGSGYSSIDVMQSIRFDVIKFDMSFMQRLNEGVSGKTILSELMRMALAMGVDTVCEGVETKEQVMFLREIGCSKLQGFYFSKPNPLSSLLRWAEEGVNLRYENPAEAEYFETMGRINLYDLSVIATEEDSFFKNYFNMLPMAVLVLGKESARYVRSNPSYRFFAKRFFDFDLSSPENTYTLRPDGAGKEFMHLVRQCCKNGKRAFVDEIMPDGSKVHSFINKIGDNPVTGESALIVAVLSVQDSNIGNTYSDVAKALAPGLYNSYHVDMETGDYVEYSAAQGREGLAMEVHGKDFFENAKRDAKMRIYKEDLAYFLEVFTKEKILETLDQQGEYVIRYRLTDTGEPMEVELKALRLHPKEQHLIIEVQVCE